MEFLLSVFVEIGGKIYTEKGMKFYIHSKESGKHHLPHIHVVYNGNEASISLDGEILVGYLPKKKLKKLKKL